MHSSHDSLGWSTRVQRAWPGCTALSSEKDTVVSRAMGPSPQRKTVRPRPSSTSTSGLGRTRFSFTSNRSAKSAPTCSWIVTGASVRPWLVTTTRSRSPRPMWRSRNATTVASAAPSLGAARVTNVAANGSGMSTATDSSGRPFTHSSKRDSIRVSRKKRPCARPGCMSPHRSAMQNVCPSTSVTSPPGRPIDATGFDVCQADGSITRRSAQPSAGRPGRRRGARPSSEPWRSAPPRPAGTRRGRSRGRSRSRWPARPRRCAGTR